MDLFFGVLIGIILLVLLVVAHELGHAIAARRNGVVVEEFGVGFPPMAWKKKLKNGILFTLNWLPLGGYVKLQGEHDAADKKGDYGAATYWQKTKILFAGVAVNWLVAAVLLSVVALFGMPKVLPNQFSIPSDAVIASKPVEITNLTPGHPAEKAGLLVGDAILKIAGVEVPTVTSLVDATKQNEGKTVDIIYSRSGEEKSISIELGVQNSGGILGAGLGQIEAIKSTWSAPIVGFGVTAQFSVVTVQGIGVMLSNLFSGVIMQFSPDSGTSAQAKDDLASVGDSVAGPIGILGSIFPAASQAGPLQLTFLTAIISLSLAVMNVLPIPALDGGRWFTMTLYKMFKKELSKEKEEKIIVVGYSILMGLTILVTLVDVAKLF